MQWTKRGSRAQAVNENMTSDVLCRTCGKTSSKVIDSRGGMTGQFVRRRRQCLHCGDRFTTYECLEHPAIAAERIRQMLVAFGEECKRAGIMLEIPKSDDVVTTITAKLDLGLEK